MRYLVPVAVLVLLVGCSAVSSVKAGVSCNRTLSPGDSSETLTAALAKAGEGDCVVGSGSFKGTFTVPAGVKLMASDGLSLSITGSAADGAAVTLMGGKGSGVYGVEVPTSAGVGIQVVGGPATVSEVKVREAANAALLISCTGATCLDLESTIDVQKPDLRDSAIGLWAYAARVSVSGGTVTGTKAQSLATGYAVVASAGAALLMDGTSVSQNGDVGVLVDGADGTSAELTDVEVSRNQGRGIWAQGLRGTDAAPKLVISGAATSIDGNAVVGVGARESTGISISDARITRTIKLAVPTQTGKLEPVGDGVGLFAASGAALLKRVTLQDNQRSQMLIDTGSRGIIIVDTGSVTGGDYKIVVQKTTESVTIPTEFLTPAASELPVSSPSLPVGAR